MLGTEEQVRPGALAPYHWIGLLGTSTMEGIGACEAAERRIGRLSWNARENIQSVIRGAGLTAIYIWTGHESPRVAALCIDARGRFYAVESNRVEPVSVARGWAFELACRAWADRRQIHDREAAWRWDEAILRQLQAAETKPGGRRPQ